MYYNRYSQSSSHQPLFFFSYVTFNKAKKTHFSNFSREDANLFTNSPKKQKEEQYLYLLQNANIWQHCSMNKIKLLYGAAMCNPIFVVRTLYQSNADVI